MKRKLLFPVLLGLVSYFLQACDNSPIDPRLSEALQQNAAANVMYAKFLSEVNSKTTFDEYFRVYDSVARTKHDLNGRLQDIHPSSRYWMLHQSLFQSVQSDEKLMVLERDSLRQVLEAPRLMNEMSSALSSGIDDPALSPEENQRRKAEAIQRTREIIKNYRDRLTRTNAALESAKTTSKQAVDLLNKEIERLGLPNKQENPFAKESTAKPSPSG